MLYVAILVGYWGVSVDTTVCKELCLCHTQKPIVDKDNFWRVTDFCIQKQDPCEEVGECDIVLVGRCEPYDT